MKLISCALLGFASVMVASRALPAQQLGCLGRKCEADAPPPTPPAGWTIVPGTPRDGKGYGYMDPKTGLVVKTCHDCIDCKITFSYSYSGSGDWSVEGGEADPETSCGQVVCDYGSGPTSGTSSLKADCNGSDSYFYSSGGQVGLAILTCPCQ